MSGPLVALVFRHAELLCRVEAELARLEMERDMLVAQRDRLLDGMWGKGAPPPEELPQVGEPITFTPSTAVRTIETPSHGEPGRLFARELLTSDIAPDPTAQLDQGWRRVLDWRNQTGFGQDVDVQRPRFEEGKD